MGEVVRLMNVYYTQRQYYSMADPNMMKSMIVIEYDILPQIEIKIDMPLILPKRNSIFIVLCDFK